MINKIAPKYFLGSYITNPKIYASKIDELIDVINSQSEAITALQNKLANGVTGSFNTNDTDVDITVTDGVITAIED